MGNKQSDSVEEYQEKNLSSKEGGVRRIDRCTLPSSTVPQRTDGIAAEEQPQQQFKKSKFVLVPASDAARDGTHRIRPSGDHTVEDDEIRLVEGDNVLGAEPLSMLSALLSAEIPDGRRLGRHKVALGIPNGTQGIHEKHALLRITSNGMVLLKAMRDVCIRGRINRPQGSPRSINSPIAKSLPQSPVGKSPSKMSSSSVFKASPPKPLAPKSSLRAPAPSYPTTPSVRSSPLPSPRRRAGGKRARATSDAGLGSVTKVLAGAQQFLLTGETLELKTCVTSAKASSASLYSYTLVNRDIRVASAANAFTMFTVKGLDRSDAKQSEGIPATKQTPTPSCLSPTQAHRGIDAQVNRAQRCLEDAFADSRGITVKDNPPPEQNSGIGRVDAAGDGRVADAEVVETTPPAADRTHHARKKRRKNRVSTTPFCPSGVVDLCDVEDRPEKAGATADVPLDLCGSEDEGEAVKHTFASSSTDTTAATRSGSPSLERKITNPPPSSGRAAEANQEPIKGAPSTTPKKLAQLLQAKLSSEPLPQPTAEAFADEPGCFPPRTGEPAARALPPAGSDERVLAKIDQRSASSPAFKASRHRTPPRSSEGTGAKLKTSSEYFDRSAGISPGSSGVGVGGDVCGEIAARCANWTAHSSVLVSGPHPAMVALRERSSPVERRPSLPKMESSFLQYLKGMVLHCPDVVISETEGWLARGGTAPRGLADLLVSQLLKSRCRVRTETLRRQLRGLLAIFPDCWSPPGDARTDWLDNLMRGITGHKESTDGSPLAPSDEVLEAHITVLEVVLKFLAAGRGGIRQLHARRGERVESTVPPRNERLGHLFERDEEKPKRIMKAALTCGPRRAVGRSASWAVKAWSMSSGTVLPDHTATDGAGEFESPAQACARLLAARFLAEVVETCGLPMSESCLLIRDQMNTGRCVLGAVARAGFMRALGERPFSADLARVMSSDPYVLASCDSGSVEEAKEEAEKKRLRLQLSRVMQRAAGVVVLL